MLQNWWRKKENFLWSRENVAFDDQFGTVGKQFEGEKLFVFWNEIFAMKIKKIEDSDEEHRHINQLWLTLEQLLKSVIESEPRITSWQSATIEIIAIHLQWIIHLLRWSYLSFQDRRSIRYSIDAEVKSIGGIDNQSRRRIRQLFSLISERERHLR